jgi:hypothetical protein
VRHELIICARDGARKLHLFPRFEVRGSHLSKRATGGAALFRE